MNSHVRNKNGIAERWRENLRQEIFIAYLYANGNTEWGENTGKAERRGWKAGLGWAEGGKVLSRRKRGGREEEKGSDTTWTSRCAVRGAHILLLFVSEMRIAGSSRGRTEGHGSQGGVKQADRMIDLNWQHRAMSEETLAGFWLAARGMALAPSEPGRREGSLWEQV